MTFMISRKQPLEGVCLKIADNLQTLQIAWKTRLKEFIFRNVARLQPATQLKLNFFTDMSQGFHKLSWTSNFKHTSR